MDIVQITDVPCRELFNRYTRRNWINKGTKIKKKKELSSVNFSIDTSVLLLLNDTERFPTPSSLSSTLVETFMASVVPLSCGLDLWPKRSRRGDTFCSPGKRRAT